MQSHVSLQSRKIGTVFISVGETGEFESAMSFFRCWHLIHFYRPKRSFGQGNIFTPVCHSVHGGGCLLQIFGGGVCPKFFWGGVCSKFSGGCLPQIFLGGSAPNFRGGVCPKFSGGVSAPNFQGGVCSKFSGGGSSNFRNTVTVRPVRILLECILVLYLFYLSFFSYIAVAFTTTLTGMTLPGPTNTKTWVTRNHAARTINVWTRNTLQTILHCTQG